MALLGAIVMKKEHVYVLIAVGVILPIWIAGAIFFSGEKPESPAVLQQRVLHGGSPEERLAAATELYRHAAAARREIRRALEASPQSDPAVRICLLQAAGEIRDWRSLPSIFTAMEDEDAVIRGQAAAAAVNIMGVNGGYVATDPPKQRDTAIERLRKELHDAADKYERFYADQKE
jgi:hypothetical protein